MSSAQLPFLSEPSAKSGFPRSEARVPIYSCFLSSSDILVVLWEHGYIEAYDLHTRLGPGKGKVMNPSKIGSWSCKVTSCRFRQIVMFASTDALNARSFTVLILGSSSESDILVVAKVDGEDYSETGTIIMPSRNGCLLRADEGVWEAMNGELFKGAISKHLIVD